MPLRADRIDFLPTALVQRARPPNGRLPGLGLLLVILSDAVRHATIAWHRREQSHIGRGRHAPVPGPRTLRAVVCMEIEQLTDARPGDLRLDEPLLTAADVADLLAVPMSSVYEYARRFRDPLPSIHIGRHRRVERNDVAAWLTRQRTARA